MLVVSSLCAPLAHAAGTPAGTVIANTASATYEDPGGTPRSTTSNTTQFSVAERLDASVAKNSAAPTPVTTPAAGVPLAFTVTNTGNGSEAFALAFDGALGGDDFDPLPTLIVLDDGDGIYEPLSDLPYVPGVNDPVLAADASRIVFVIADVPPGLGDGALGSTRLTATSATGSGAPGTTFAGLGDGGVDAVVGSTTASAADAADLLAQQAGTVLTKAQSVLDPLGGASGMPGAVITYTLTLTATGTGTLAGLVISDAIPAGTTYVPDSLRLQGLPLTDLPDLDAGRFTGTAIEVSPGDLVAPAVRTVLFQVLVNN